MRIDSLLVKNGIFSSRNKAKESLARGEIYYRGERVVKSSLDLNENDFSRVLIVRTATEFVSVGGYKLEKALTDFSFSVKGLVCADVGASTGGFTDCLIKNGAAKVYAVDLNDGLLSEKLKNDCKVVPLIKNARNLCAEDFKEEIDLITADLSFISATYVLPVFSEILKEDGHALILIKPQFENDAKIKFKNGVIKDDKIKLRAIEKVVNSAVDFGFLPLKINSAPKNKDKNDEYLLLLKRKDQKDFKISSLKIEEIL